jgi:AAA domain
VTKTPTPGEAKRTAQEAGGNVPPARRLVLTPASQIQPEPVIWAWEDNGAGRIPAGSFGLFAGREGTGKSSFLIWLSAQVTKGELPGALKGDPRPVVYIAVEDSWKYTIVPRLMAAGADLAKVYRAEVETVEGETVTLSLPSDNCLLEDAIRQHHIALVAIDPLISAISDHLDTHVNRQVRQALDPLARLADRTGAVVAGIAHFNKSSGTDASSLITASGAFKDVARYIFAFAADDEDGTQVITQTKNSLGHSNLPSLAYRIIEATVPTARGDARVGRFILDGETDRTVRDILSPQDDRDARDEKTRAEDYLRKALANGPRRTAEVEDEARHAHMISKRTLDRARQNLRIPTARHGSSWWISLPEHEGDLADLPGETAKDANRAKDGTVGNVAKDANTASPGKVGTVGTVPDGPPEAGTYISAETLRHREVRRGLGDGSLGPPEDYYDLRGTPIGERAQVWEWDRLVPPRFGKGRRVREYIKVMHCPEGWHSTSGSASNPLDPEVCQAIMNGNVDLDKFHAFHADHHVVWVVRVRVHTRTTILRYCDPELPAEYRPEGMVGTGAQR